MIKNSFLDTNVVINYVNFNENSYNNLSKKCYDYVINKKGKFILCMFVIKEIYNLLERRSVIYKAVIEKIKKDSFSLEENLFVRDVPFAKKLYIRFKDSDVIKLSKDFQREKMNFEIKVEQFLKFVVDEKVISVESIDSQLVNKIYDYIDNHADCRVLASAIQYQKGKNKFLFVTVDKEHFDLNGYDFLKEQFEINYKEENYEFPELHNLLFLK